MKILIVLLSCLAVASAFGYGGYSRYSRYGRYNKYPSYGGYSKYPSYGGYSKYSSYGSYKYPSYGGYNKYQSYGYKSHNGGYHYSSSCYLPPSECFTYKGLFKNEWCTTAFYSDVLSYYPDDAKNILPKANATDQVVTALLNKRTNVIDKAIEAHQTNWRSDLLIIVNRFKSEHTTCINNRYASRISLAISKNDTTEQTRLETERDLAISNYDRSIEIQYNATKATSDAEAARIKQKVISFHDSIKIKFEQCYDTREAKITTFEEQLNTTVAKYKKDYKTALETDRDSSTAAFKAVLEKICGTIAIPPSLVTEFENTFKVDEKVTKYDTDIDEKANDLKTCYRCALKCYQSSGCLTFRRNTYYQHCRSLGNWWHFTIPRFNAPCFRIYKYKYTWHKLEYNSLSTCDNSTVNADKDVLEADWIELNSNAVKAARIEMTNFIDKWEGIHSNYVDKLASLINSKNTAEVQQKTQYYKSLRTDGILTASDNAAISALQSSLEASKNATMIAYEAKLKADRDSAETTGTASIDAWEANINATVTNILQKYQDHLTTRTANINIYINKVATLRNNRKECLTTNLKAVTEKNVDHAKAVINAWFTGSANFTDSAPATAWINSYKQKLEGNDAVVNSTFEAHWNALEPKLILDYECKYKCIVGEYRVSPWRKPSFFSWKTCYPTTGYLSHSCGYSSYTKPTSYHHHYYYPKTTSYYYYPKTSGHYYHTRTSGHYY